MHKQSWRCIAAHLFFICASYLFPLFLPLNTLPCLVLFLFSLPLTITCSWPSVWASDSSLFLSLSLQTITLTQLTPSLSSLLHVLQFFICSLLSLWATDSSHSLSLSFISLSLSWFLLVFDPLYGPQTALHCLIDQVLWWFSRNLVQGLFQFLICRFQGHHSLL